MIESNESTTIDSKNECPFCNGALERGYIFANTYIRWIEHTPRWYAPGGKNLAHAFNWATLEAFKCSSCETVIVPKQWKDDTER